MINISADAMKKRTTEITKGCACWSPILVTVEAEAHRIAKTNPTPIYPTLPEMDNFIIQFSKD